MSTAFFPDTRRPLARHASFSSATVPVRGGAVEETEAEAAAAAAAVAVALIGGGGAAPVWSSLTKWMVLLWGPSTLSTGQDFLTAPVAATVAAVSVALAPPPPPPDGGVPSGLDIANSGVRCLP